MKNRSSRGFLEQRFFLLLFGCRFCRFCRFQRIRYGGMGFGGLRPWGHLCDPRQRCRYPLIHLFPASPISSATSLNFVTMLSPGEFVMVVVVARLRTAHWSFRRSRVNRQLPAEQAADFRACYPVFTSLFFLCVLVSMNGKESKLLQWQLRRKKI